MGTEAVWVPLVMAAVATGASVYNTRQTERRQDNALAQQIRNLREVVGRPDRLCGVVALPGHNTPLHILVVQRNDGWVALPAACPHEGHRLDHSPEDSDGRLICPAHGLQVETADENAILQVRQVGDDFCIVTTDSGATTHPTRGEVARLRIELEALRQANTTLEQQITAVTGMMDARLP